MTLCASCRRVIFLCSDRELMPVGSRTYRNIHWTHWVPPLDRHDAAPLPFNRHPRLLLCSTCHGAQVHDVEGWHCRRCNHT